MIDFIDMEHRGNNGKVERRMRDALSNDKARVQVGRISNFGLMELSRQRLSASLSESQYETCPHCEGRGLIRTADATSLLVLRTIEAEGIKKRAAQIIAHVPANVALYLLNYKRAILADIEARYDIQILIRVDDDIAASNYRVEVSKPIESDHDNEDEEKTEKRSRNRRGGRGRGKGKGQNKNGNTEAEEANGNKAESEDNDEPNGNIIEEPPEDVDGNSKKPTKKRGGRKKAPAKKAAAKKVEIVEEKPKKRGRPSKKTKVEEAEKTPEAETKKADKKPAAKKKTPAKKAKSDASNDDTPENNAAAEHETVNEAPKKKKKGWWSKG